MILTEIHPSETKLTATGIQALRTDYQEKRLTGLIRVALGGDNLLYLFYNQGQAAFSFLKHEEQGEAKTAEEIQEMIGRASGANVRSVVLSLPALRVCKIAVCHPNPGSTLNTSTNQLPQLLDNREKEKEACFIRVRWKNSEGLTLYSGETWSTSILFLSNETREGDAMTLFSSRPETSCEVTRFTVPQNSAAWQEYHLQRAFAAICTFMFKRYEEFTGSGLVQSAIWMMSEAAAAEQINVKVRQLQLEDQNLFPGSEKAAYAYRLLLGKLTGRIRSLLGPALLNSITADAAFELSPCQRTVARIHRLLELGITIPILRETRGIS
jgi:hypothetical protein